MTIEIITKVLIPIFGAIMMYIIVPYIKSKTTKEQLNEVKFWAEMAVGGAEQIFNYKHAGKEKKEFVLEFLHEKGFTEVSAEDLELIMEAMVRELNNSKEELKK